MKKFKTVLSLLLAIVLCFGLAACGKEEKAFSPSNYVDEDGHWKDVVAKNFIDPGDYDGVKIYQTEIDEMIDQFRDTYYDLKAADAAIELGTTINLDYVGSIDGVEFEGGNTNGQGTEIVVGSAGYIDDFEEQLVGHKAGDKFSIDVTFPEEYDNDDLKGKDAVFAITINTVYEHVKAELTDEWVNKNFHTEYGWSTVEDFNKGIKSQLAIDTAYAGAVYSDVPQIMVDFQMDYLVNYYKQMASYYGTDFATFLTSYMGYESEEAFRAEAQDYCTSSASYFLFYQAVAEDLGLSLTEDEAKAYYEEHYGAEGSDYETILKSNGIGYVKTIILSEMAQNYIAEHAVVE